MTPLDTYKAVNATWPATIPTITRAEATRAAAKLVTHFKGPRYAARVRRCWIAADPRLAGRLSRGWRRLVHDVSHRVAKATTPNFTNHGGFHARLELEMVAYVVSKGWLAGTLKPKERAAPKATPADKLADTLEAIKRWTTKRKRAETALKKLRARAKRYAKAVDKASTTE